MPWGGAPSTNEADAIRALVGDTDASNPLLADDVYTLIIATEPRLYARAAMAASALAGKYAGEMNKRVGDLWREAKVLYEHYIDLAQRLRLDAARRGKPIPWAGGTSLDDIDTRREDIDRPDNAFEVGMQDSDFVPPRDDDEQ